MNLMLKELRELEERYSDPEKYRKDYDEPGVCPLCNKAKQMAGSYESLVYCQACIYKTLIDLRLIKQRGRDQYYYCCDVGSRLPHYNSSDTVIKNRLAFVREVIGIVEEISKNRAHYNKKLKEISR